MLVQEISVCASNFLPDAGLVNGVTILPYKLQLIGYGTPFLPPSLFLSLSLSLSLSLFIDHCDIWENVVFIALAKLLWHEFILVNLGSCRYS